MSKRRRKNINEPGHAHALTFSCYRGFKFLARDRSRQWLMDAVRAARDELEFDVWAYVIMPEHAHLLVRPRRPVYDIAVVRGTVKEPVGRAGVAWLAEHAPHWLPRITRRRGKRTERLFWQSGGGYDRNIIEPKTLSAQIDYFHANPVRRGLCERPEDWFWSSAAHYAGTGPVPLIPDPIPPEWTHAD